MLLDPTNKEREPRRFGTQVRRFLIVFARKRSKTDLNRSKTGSISSHNGWKLGDSAYPIRRHPFFPSERRAKNTLGKGTATR